jgi:hypothetical protein
MPGLALSQGIGHATFRLVNALVHLEAKHLLGDMHPTIFEGGTKWNTTMIP